MPVLIRSESPTSFVPNCNPFLISLKRYRTSQCNPSGSLTDRLGKRCSSNNASFDQIGIPDLVCAQLQSLFNFIKEIQNIPMQSIGQSDRQVGKTMQLKQCQF